MTTLNDLHREYHLHASGRWKRKSTRPVRISVADLTREGRRIQGRAGTVYRRLIELEVTARMEHAEKRYQVLTKQRETVVTFRSPGTIKIEGTLKL